MINLLLFLMFMTCLGITAAWIAENPGDVTIHWFNYQIDTSLAFLLLLALIAAVLLAYLYMVIRGLILTPTHFVERRELKYYRKGLTELTHSVAALAASDIKEAEAHTRKAEKMLGRTPLTLLLSAQIARSRGDDENTRLLLEQMLEHEETEYLAARSLSDAATKKQLFPKALALAQRAQAINPQGTASLVSLHLRIGQWQEALAAIQKAVRRRKIARVDARRYKGLVYLQQGQEALQNGQPEAAEMAARYALKELPNFIPVICFAARVFAANGKQRKAIRVIFDAWKKSPHLQLSDTLRSITAQEPEKLKKLQQQLIALHPSPPTDRTWGCTACGHTSEPWQVFCPSCDAFDTLKMCQIPGSKL